MNVIDMRIRPPFGHFKKAFYFEEDMRTRWEKQTMLPAPKSAYEASLDIFLQEMDEAGIEKGVIWPRTAISVDAQTSTALEVNDEMVDIVTKYPDRFMAAAAIDVHDMGLTSEIIDKYIVEGPLCAAILEPGMAAEWRFDDPRLYPVYDKCQRLGIPVFHTSGMSWAHLADSTPFAVDNVAVDFPDLKIVVSHAVWPWVTQAIWTVLTKPNVFLMPDLYLLNCPGWRDYATAIANPFMNANMLYASAYPFCGLKEGIQYSKDHIDFPDPQLAENYFYNNAKQILGI